MIFMASTAMLDLLTQREAFGFKCHKNERFCTHWARVWSFKRDCGEGEITNARGVKQEGAVYTYHNLVH